MSETNKFVRLVLNTNNFYPNGNGTINGSGALNSALGNADPARITCTYSYLDWTVILGDMYDKYSTFSIVIESLICTSNGGTPVPAVNNLFPGNVIRINASGPEWVNQTYDSVARACNDIAFLYLGSYVPPTLFPQYGAIFKRPPRFRDLTFTIVNPFTNVALIQGGADRPLTYIYYIRIYGIDKIDKI